MYCPPSPREPFWLRALKLLGAKDVQVTGEDEDTIVQFTIEGGGDGDFRPKFEWGAMLPDPKGGDESIEGHWFFDAG